MASFSYALLLVCSVVGSTWAVDSSSCSLEVEVTYADGAAPSVTCSDTCSAGDGNDLWIDAVGYQRLDTLRDQYGLMVKVQYSAGGLSGCSTVAYQSEEAVDAAAAEVQACVDEALPDETTAAPTTAAPEPTCPEGFFSLVGFCYLVSPSAITRSTAITFCQDNGAVLAAIESQEEQDALAAVLDNHTFIGINDIAEEGTWTTLLGEPVTYTNWNDGEPNGGTTENCLVLRKNRDFRWNDVSCEKTFQALCKTDPTVAA